MQISFVCMYIIVLYARAKCPPSGNKASIIIIIIIIIMLDTLGLVYTVPQIFNSTIASLLTFSADAPHVRSVGKPSMGIPSFLSHPTSRTPSLVAVLLGECTGRLNQHGAAAVNAKVNFSMLYLISEVVAGFHTKLYQVCCG